jgi:hypothetical protein
MAVLTENENIDTNVFTPFNDSNPFHGFVNPNPILSNSLSRGYDTREIDLYRQGIELRTSKHVYGSTQPKLWSGNLEHIIIIRTIGQARSFTEYENSPVFEEKPRFNPVQYIEDDNYPLPITFNEGPQQEEEAIIEPLPIPFRRADNQGKFPARGVKASLEDGNNFDNEDGSTTRVEQFYNFTQPEEPRFFLDEGQQYIGDSVEEAIVVEGYTPIIQRNIAPFDETKDESIVASIRTTDPDFISVLKKLNFDLDGDITEEFDKKSMTAGYDVYGTNGAKYGTDSIAYIGRILGA